MSHRLDDLYIDWLYSQVAPVSVSARSKSYWCLIRQLFKKEFVWTVPNDDNRCEDGIQLRYDFINGTGLSADEEWLQLGCSMLEVLIGLAGRLSFLDGGEVKYWFWHMLENIGLEQCTDARYNAQIEKYVANAIDSVIDRTYARDGRGGLFPLRNPEVDQREAELWYQLNAYLLEAE